jgi:hypothetical protein
MYITKLTGEFDVEKASAAFKDALCDFTDLRDNQVVCETVAELGRFQQVEAPLAALDCAVDLVRESRQNNQKSVIHEEFLNAFAFPLYHASKKPNKDLQHTMQLLFTHFLIGLLEFVNPEDLLDLLTHQIEVLEPPVFRGIIELFLKQLDYEYGTAKVVQQMAVTAYQDALRKAFHVLGRGFLSDENGLCNTCGRLLNQSTDQVAVFPCSHSFHTVVACLPNERKCPLCSEQKGKLKTAGGVIVEKVQATKLTRWFRWFNQILRPNYEVTAKSSAAETYFVSLGVVPGDVPFETRVPDVTPDLHFDVSEDTP